MQYLHFTKTPCLRHVSCVGYLHTAVEAETLFLQSRHLRELSLPSVCSLWCLCANLGPHWAGAESVAVFSRKAVARNYSTLPAFPPETFSLMAGPWNQTHCWFPSHCYICNHSCECGYPLLLCCRSHFRVVLPLLKLFTYSLALASCWVGLGQEHIGGGRSVICVVVGGGRLTS